MATEYSTKNAHFFRDTPKEWTILVFLQLIPHIIYQKIKVHNFFIVFFVFLLFFLTFAFVFVLLD